MERRNATEPTDNTGATMTPLILIVEDEEPLAEMLRYNLDKAGFRTILAATGEDALQQVDLEMPDLAVVDWMLPERSGIEVCRALRAKDDTRKLPIIMLTARSGSKPAPTIMW